MLSFHALSYICSSCSRFMHHHRSSCSRFMHYHRSSCSRFMHYHHPALALASCIIIVLSFHALSCIVSCSRFMYSHAFSIHVFCMFVRFRVLRTYLLPTAAGRMNLNQNKTCGTRCSRQHNLSKLSTPASNENE